MSIGQSCLEWEQLRKEKKNFNLSKAFRPLEHFFLSVEQISEQRIVTIFKELNSYL